MSKEWLLIGDFPASAEIEKILSKSFDLGKEFKSGSKTK